MKKTIMAKSRTREKGLKEQSLVEHTEDLLYVYNKILPLLQEKNEFKDNLKLICVLHDLGKMNIKFQEKIELANEIDDIIEDEEKLKKLRRKYKNIDDKNHNILTGASLKSIFDKKEISKNIRPILYKADMLHHGNQLRYISIPNSEYEKALYEDVEIGILKSEEYNVKEVEEFIEKTLEIDVNFRDNDFLDYDFLNYLNERFIYDEEGVSQQELYSQYILYKGFLNLIDHIASTQMKDIKYINDMSDEVVDERLLNHLSNKNKEKNLLMKFNQLQLQTRENKSKNIITTAFTGSGKTIGDYRWGGKRKVYLVPTKISAESFYFDAIDILDEEMVGILHGDISLYLENENSEDDLSISIRDNILTRNLSKPYTIATVDQYLISMFKYPNYEKTLASIYNSNITVDEVHLLTPRMFLILIYFIQFAHKYLNAKFHLMTATMPTIYKGKLRECNVDFKHIDIQNIKKGQEINIKCIKEKDIYDIIHDGLKKDYKILIVKNTVESAIDTYLNINSRLKGRNINLLHSRFKLEDKKEKYKKLRNQEGDIWIATQMVEISLDLDFQIVISDSAPMDSIIQRMGRCNRHDSINEGLFYLLDNYKDNIVYNQVLKEETYKLLKGEDEKTLTMGKREELLNDYYNNKSVAKYYQDEFKNAENDLRNIFGIANDGELNGESLIFNYEPYLNIVDNKREADMLFRNVEMDTKVIFQKDLEKIEGMVDKKKFYRMIQGMSIPISRGIYFKLMKDEVLRKKGKLNVLVEDTEERGWVYDDKVGLRED